MPAAVYECMFLLDTNKVAGDVQGASKQLHGILEKHNAEVLASRPWNEGRLAYPIKGHKKGLYYLTYFRTEGPNLAKIEADFTLNEMILRSLTLKIDPKLVNIMLQLAQDAHAVALKTASDMPEDEGGAPEGDHPRRRPRPQEVGEGG